MRQALNQLTDPIAKLAEGPVWDETKDCLYWVDIPGNAVHRFDVAHKQDVVYAMPSMVGCAVLRRQGGLVICLKDGFYAFDEDTRALERIGGRVVTDANSRFNDGKVAPGGYLFAGTMEMEERTPESALYRLDPDHSLHCVVTGITTSNGLAFDEKRHRFYYTDTPTRRIDAFDYDAANGSLCSRRPCVHIPDGAGMPDGMCIDTDGMLWVAHWDGAHIGCYNPDNGKLLERIDVPAKRTTSCCFGGDDFGTLYITTAQSDASNGYDQGGALFAIRPGATGSACMRYAG